MSINNIVPQIKKIFVGRHSELQTLRKLWEFACEEGEHAVQVFLNAPGVGKTTLITQFGKEIEENGLGLYIRFICSNNYDSSTRLNRDIIKLVEKAFYEKKGFITNFINQLSDINQRKWKEKKLGQFNKLLNEISSNLKPSLNDIKDVFLELSGIIPLFFSADEVQEFQKLTFKQSEGKEETALHYFTRILKDLITLNILLVLSGTRYHILSQIGDKIGSPIRQKVEPLIVSNFTIDELNDYVNILKAIIEKENIVAKGDTLSTQMDNYYRFLLAFSNGHPRTIEKASKIFVQNLTELTTNPQYKEYDHFLTHLLPKAEEIFGNTIISSAYKNALLELNAREGFSIIKKWMLSKGSTGQSLGIRPKDSDSSTDEELKRIVYELMNIGIIVQNGQNNYYITSYFHFVEYLKVYNEPYEVFLNQVLNNKCFKLMCGSHSGFGYTFEDIFSAALFMFGRKALNSNKTYLIPLDASLIKSITTIKGNPDWSSIIIVQDVLYQTPMAKVIDAFIVQEGELLLIQLTTAIQPDPLKIQTLLEQIEQFPINSFEGKIQSVRGWIASLFDFKEEAPILKNLMITTGDSLASLFGKELYERLLNVKQSFL